MQPLIETSVNPLVAQDGKILSGLFAEMDTLNQNGRRYPASIYESSMEELLPKIKEKRLLGELDHPMDYDEVRLSNVSHAITDCFVSEEDGVKKIYGTVELLDTPSGLIAQSLVRAGIPLGISSRGIGATKQVRDGVEVTQLKLITYDLVAEPSFSNAVLSPDKSQELSDSLNYIESKLPLTESTEITSVRSMIHNIRESLINRKIDPIEEVNINEVEINSLKNLLESANLTIKSDTCLLVQNRNQIKDLQDQLKESEKKYRATIKNMFKLQEAYNSLKENSCSLEEVDRLNETIIELKKKLEVERRGMSYDQVSDLLEGAKTDEEIMSRLSSINSISKKRQPVVIDKRTLTESSDSFKSRKLAGLASIIANV